MALFTSADLAAWKPISGPDSTFVETAVSAVDAWVKRYVGYEIESDDYEERLSGRGTPILKPRRWPITAVSSLKVDGVTWAVLAWDDETDADEEVFLPEHGKWLEARNLGVYGGGKFTQQPDDQPAFPRGAGNVWIEYTAGYAAIPEDLKLVCVQLSVLVLHEQSGLLGHGSKTVGDMSIQQVLRDAKDYQFIVDVLNAFRER